MSAHGPEHGSLLDDLLRDARSVDLDDEERDDDALVARAALAGRARHEARMRRNVAVAFGGTLAIAAMIGLAWLGLRTPAVADLVELTLPAGDQLAATGDARFDVTSSAPTLRVVRLHRGAMVFDVAPLGAGSRFEVETPDARVRVRGTVFAVDIGEHGTAVHVYEGRVELEREGAAPIVLRAGESSGDLGGERLAHLDGRGRRAAARRALALLTQREPVPTTSTPTTTPSEAEHAPPTPSSATVSHPRAPARPRANDRARADAPTETAIDEQLTELAEARRMLGEGRSEEALETARAHLGSDPSWRLLEADALRGLGRAAEAADAYEDAAHRLSGVASRTPAFLAAELRLRRLSDPSGALRVLDETGADAAGSPLRERGLALRADALEQLGRTAELARVAEQYLEELPDGPRAESMRAHVVHPR